MAYKELKMEDTSDLREFMIFFKGWAEDQRENMILGIIQRAENRGLSASELIIEYGNALKAIQTKYYSHLPEQFRLLVDRGVKVSDDAVSLESAYRAS